MYGLNVDPRNPQGDPVPDRLRALGVEIVRYTFKDATLGQLPDRDVVGFYRRYVEALAMAGVKSLVVLTGETWAGRPEPSASKEAWDHYLVGFARRIAAILATGQTNSVRITVRNTTFKTWPSGGPYPVRLGYHWHTTNGDIVPSNLWEDLRTQLPYDVVPGDTVTFNCNVGAPRAAGMYEIRWDMVEELRTWFAWQGAPTLNLRVTVKDETSPPPPGGLQVSASHNNQRQGIDNLQQAIDNNAYTRWSTQQPQRPGIELKFATTL